MYKRSEGSAIAKPPSDGTKMPLWLLEMTEYVSHIADILFDSRYP